MQNFLKPPGVPRDKLRSALWGALLSNARRTGALGIGVHMNSKRLKFGLSFLCAGVVSAIALFSYAGAVQNRQWQAASVADRLIPIDCSFAVGIEGKDFVRDDEGAHCRMLMVTFRRLYPEIAQYVDESTWE
jgi:hypothetical protein